MRSTLIFVLMVVVACLPDPSQQDFEVEAAQASKQGWEEQQLPEPRDLSLERVEVRFPTTEDFDHYCYPATTKTAHACFRWLLLHHKAMGLYSREHAVVFVRPEEPDSTVGHLVIHELMHAFVSRSLPRPSNDPFDYEHTLADVWRNRGMDCAEYKAQVIFDGALPMILRGPAMQTAPLLMSPVEHYEEL